MLSNGTDLEFVEYTVFLEDNWFDIAHSQHRKVLYKPFTSYSPASVAANPMISASFRSLQERENVYKFLVEKRQALSNAKVNQLIECLQ